MPIDLPRGLVTFVFSDIDGSTIIIRDIGTLLYEQYLLEPHRVRLRELAEKHSGGGFPSAGDGFISVFQDPDDAVAFAVEVQHDLASTPIGYKSHILSVKIGVHTCREAVKPKSLQGQHHATWRDLDYNGNDVNYASRIVGIARASQILLSNFAHHCVQATQSRYQWQEWKHRKLKSFDEAESVWELIIGTSKGEPGKLWVPKWYREPSYGYIPRPGIHKLIAPLLHNPHCRIITLHAGGGMGKTELAINRAYKASDTFSDGVVYIELDARFDHKADLAAHMGKHLGLPLEQSTPDRIMDYLESKDILFVLEHFDYLINDREKAKEARAFVSDLLQRAPGVRLLITCRTETAIDGEQIVSVRGMQFEEAKRLFVAVARSRDIAWSLDDRDLPGFRKLIEELCLSMPIAIMIAASQARNRSIQEIYDSLSATPLPVAKSVKGMSMDELDDSLRHRSVERSIAWSYNLLSPKIQEAFLILSFFPGGATFRSFSQALGEHGEEVLEQLLDASLAEPMRSEVHSEPHRFHLNSFTSSFARLIRVKSPSPRLTELHDRVSEYFLGLASEAVPVLDREDLDNRIGRLDAELRNVREAFRHIAATDPVRVAKLAAQLWRFWWTLGHAAEGTEILASVLPFCKHEHNVYAHAALVIGHLERHRGRFTKETSSSANGASEWFQEALNHADDLALRSDILRMFGLLEWHLENIPKASEYLQSALDVALESRDDLRIADAYYERANNLLRETDTEKAIEDIERSLGPYKQSGDLTKTGTAFLSLANTLYKAGRVEEARGKYAEALVLFARTRFKSRLAMVFERAARIAAHDAAPGDAANLLGKAAELRKAIGNPIAALDFGEYLKDLFDDLKKSLSVEGYEDAYQQGTSITIAEALPIAERHLAPIH